MVAYNHFRNRLGDTVKRVKRKLLETSSNTPRGKSTSHIKHDRDSYKCGGTKFKNRY